MPAITQVVAQISATLSKTLDLSPGSQATITAALQATLPSGIADGSADKVWGDTGTLSASATVDLDLFGSLLDAFGDVFSPVEITALIVMADAGNTNDVVVGGAAATQFVGPFGAATHTHKVRPGGAYMWYAPAGHVNAAGADFLRIANGGAGTPVTYSVVIIGRSA